MHDRCAGMVDVMMVLRTSRLGGCPRKTRTISSSPDTVYILPVAEFVLRRLGPRNKFGNGDVQHLRIPDDQLHRDLAAKIGDLLSVQCICLDGADPEAVEALMASPGRS